MPEAHCFAIPLPVRFRGLRVRSGLVWRGPAGWAEWSPFPEYGDLEAATWLRAADEAAELGWPEPLRSTIPVNCTVPAVAPEQAHALVATSGCRTAKVKVAEPGQSLAADLARVEAVRDALGTGGRVRVDANGGWSVDQAVAALTQIARDGLEYAEQPCRSVDELVELRLTLARRGVDVLIAADESIRRADDPYVVAEREAADVAVLKVQPLGGVRACLRVAERIGLPVVVSSALETSVGIAAGVALAAALPDLPYACGLNTVPLLAGDLASEPFVARRGELTVRPVVVPAERLSSYAADPALTADWQARLLRVRALDRARAGALEGGRG